MAIDLKMSVDALRWVLGDSPVVEFLGTIEEYVIACEKERDEAKAAEAAARAALAKAQADAAALSEKLNIIFEDLKDGVLDNPEVIV